MRGLTSRTLLKARPHNFRKAAIGESNVNTAPDSDVSAPVRNGHDDVTGRCACADCRGAAQSLEARSAAAEARRSGRSAARRWELTGGLTGTAIMAIGADIISIIGVTAVVGSARQTADRIRSRIDTAAETPVRQSASRTNWNWCANAVGGSWQAERLSQRQPRYAKRQIHSDLAFNR